jgi:hypothetical protein
MKNFPDHNQFDELEKRLQSYTEQPDDLVWENIDAALRPSRTLLWLPWVDYLTSSVSIFLCALAINAIQLNYIFLNSDIIIEKKAATPHHKTFENNGPLEKNTNTENQNHPPSPRLASKNSLFSRNDSEPQDKVVFSNATEFMAETDTQSLSHSTEPNEISLNTPSTDTLFVPTVEVPKDSLTQNQQVTKQSTRIQKRRPAFYAHVTPSLSFQRTIPVGSDEVVVQEISNASILSSERFGISLDIGVQGFISKRFEYYGGLSLYHQNQTLKFSYQQGNQVNVESSGDNRYTVTPKLLQGVVNYEMLNLGLQAGILYNLYGKTLTHKIGAGVSYQQGLKKTDSESYKNSESSYFSYQVFYRNEIRVSSRVRVFVQPVFMQSIRVREKLDAPFNLKPYRAGIGFGILYDF